MEINFPEKEQTCRITCERFSKLINHRHFGKPEFVKYYDSSIVLNIMESKKINLSRREHEFWINISINVIDIFDTLTSALK